MSIIFMNFKLYRLAQNKNMTIHLFDNCSI